MRRFSAPSKAFPGAAFEEPSGGLLGLLAAPAAHPDALNRALACMAPSEIPVLLERIAFHRIDGLAHCALSRLPVAEVNPWLRFTLRRRHQRRAARALVQQPALAELLEALDRASVPVAVMRGLRAAEWIYGDHGSRPFENHDLLARPEDISAVRMVLRRHGYEEPGPGSFRRGGMSVDLHCGEPDGGIRRARGSVVPFSVSSLFACALPGTVAGAPALLLRPEDELVLLCLNLVRNSFGRLLGIADLGHLLAEHGGMLCWEAVRQRAASWRALRPVQLALAMPPLVGVSVPGPLHPGSLGPVEGFLLRRALGLRPVPQSGKILLALAAPTLADGARAFLRFLPRRGRAAAAGPRRIDPIAPRPRPRDARIAS